MPRYEADVDPQVCTAAQMCVSVAPDHFVFDDEAGVSRFPGGPADDEAILDAAEMCPVEAITVRDVDTGEQLYP